MNKLLHRILPWRSHVRHNGTYPVVGIEELRWKKQHASLKDTSVTVRDYYEWKKLYSLMKYETFFTHRGRDGHSSATQGSELLLYDPIVTHCIAKWLFMDYKLNAYPYHDLNIINIYTDLHQSLHIAKTMMTYFKTVLSGAMFERIRYIMVPLYNHPETIQSTKACQDIPGEVTLINNNAVFLSQFENESNENHPFIIEDPVSIIMLNDVLKHLSHDLVRYSHERGEWEQAYFAFNHEGLPSLRFEHDLDFWCKYAIRKGLDDQVPNIRESTQRLYVPTRLAQLLDVLKRFAPQHKFMAIDQPLRWDPGFMAMLKILFGYKSIRGSKIIEPHSPSIWRKEHSEVDGPIFTTDFTQVQQMYMNINGMGKISEINDLGEFVEQWINLQEDYSHGFSRDSLEAQLEMIKESSLAIIHSD